MEAIISLKNAQIYQRNELVLSEINFQLSENEVVYLIGKTGSGKSSLLKTFFGELPLKEGEGEVSGYNLRKLRRKQVPQLRRKIGIVFQDFQLLTDRSVLKNLFFVLKSTGWKDKDLMKKRAMEVLTMVGLEEKQNAMPYALSGGEQQRVAIARALLNKPELILADEPTGNLDPETSEEIMRILIASARESRAAVVMATHDMGMVEKFPGRILRVQDKSLKEVGHLNDFNPFNTFLGSDSSGPDQTDH